MIVIRNVLAGMLVAVLPIAVEARAPRHAAECDAYAPIRAMRGDAVFLGRVLGWSEKIDGRWVPSDSVAETRWFGGEVRVRMAVDLIWRGPDSSEVMVHGIRDPEGFPVRAVGERWLIVAYRDRGRELRASICGGTMPYGALADSVFLRARQEMGITRAPRAPSRPR